MKTTIDSGGRLIIPKEIRRQAGLKTGMSLDVRLRGGLIEIEPTPLNVKLERRGRLLVAIPQETVPALTSLAVEDTRRKVRRERGDS
jgi:AbrB family looped-hinge helix DNA binding protein